MTVWITVEVWQVESAAADEVRDKFRNSYDDTVGEEPKLDQLRQIAEDVLEKLDG